MKGLLDLYAAKHRVKVVPFHKKLHDIAEAENLCDSFVSKEYIEEVVNSPGITLIAQTLDSCGVTHIKGLVNIRPYKKSSQTYDYEEE